MTDLADLAWPRTTPANRDELARAQYTELSTVGHLDQALCFARVGSALANIRLACGEIAAFAIERYDYRTGVTFGKGESAVFRPGVIMTRVCPLHAELVADEPGLIAWSLLDYDARYHTHVDPEVVEHARAILSIAL